LTTFYFTQKFPKGPLSPEDEDEAADLIDAYGSYLDIYKCLVFAGKLRSKRLVDKLVGVAKYDYQHKEAVKALRKAKVLVFYEPVCTCLLRMAHYHCSYLNSCFISKSNLSLTNAFVAPYW